MVLLPRARERFSVKGQTHLEFEATLPEINDPAVKAMTQIVLLAAGELIRAHNARFGLQAHRTNAISAHLLSLLEQRNRCVSIVYLNHMKLRSGANISTP